jgi:hypothetical protein
LEGKKGKSDFVEKKIIIIGFVKKKIGYKKKENGFPGSVQCSTMGQSNLDHG